MKKFIYIFILMHLCIGQLISQSYFINDSFESYTPNTFPSFGGWVLEWNGAGYTYNVVTIEQANSGIQSMRMQGQSNWAAQMYKPINTITDSIICIEGFVRGSATGTGVAGDNASIIFGNKDEGPWGTDHAVVSLCAENGTIWCGSWNYDTTSYMTIQSSNANEWYKIKLLYNITGNNIKVWINGNLKVNNFPTLPSNLDINMVALKAGWGSTAYYFDDIKVWWGDTSSSVVENEPLNDHLLYPNPTNNPLTISINGIKNIIINDLVGKTCMKIKTRDNKISLTDLKPGSYVISVYSVDNGLLLTEKVIKISTE